MNTSTTTNGARAGDQIPPDGRSIDEMPFAGTEKLPAEALRKILRQCGVNVAHEIETLGCTGLYKNGFTCDDINEVRVALGGGGVGLPCFVPPDRYCTAHSTIGGLMPQQKASYADQVPFISRALTPEERGHAKLIEAAQHMRSDDRRDVVEALSGYKLPDGFEEMPTAEQEVALSSEMLLKSLRQVEAGGVTMTPAVAWKCPEHSKTEWNCRYCAAQAVVEGPLEPVYAIDKTAKTANPVLGLSPAAVEHALAELCAEQFNSAVIYVRVATYTKKLARD